MQLDAAVCLAESGATAYLQRRDWVCRLHPDTGGRFEIFVMACRFGNVNRKGISRSQSAEAKSAWFNWSWARSWACWSPLFYAKLSDPQTTQNKIRPTPLQLQVARGCRTLDLLKEATGQRFASNRYHLHCIAFQHAIARGILTAGNVIEPGLTRYIEPTCSATGMCVWPCTKTSPSLSGGSLSLW